MKIIYLSLIAVLFFAGCGSDKSKDEQAIKDVIYRNMDADNNKDVVAYMSTIDKENRNYDRMEEMKNTIYKTYDLNYQVNDLKVTELNDNEAKVNFVQIIKKINGPRFRDNRTNVIYTLHKTNGEWKIFYTQITKMEYLN